LVNFGRLAAQAFRSILSKKQTAFLGVIDWLNTTLADAVPFKEKEALKLAKAVQQGNIVFRNYRY